MDGPFEAVVTKTALYMLVLVLVDIYLHSFSVNTYSGIAGSTSLGFAALTSVNLTFLR